MPDINSWLGRSSNEVIVERASTISTFYRSITEDGKLWCESRNPQEVVERSEGPGYSFEKLDVYEVVGYWEIWNPHA